MAADFPYARSLIAVRSQRTHKKSGESSEESRYYLSSREPGEHTAAQWLGLIRGHWGGVENRNHWRRDALMGEDGSRSRNATLLGRRGTPEEVATVVAFLASSDASFLTGETIEINGGMNMR